MHARTHTIYAVRRVKAPGPSEASPFAGLHSHGCEGHVPVFTPMASLHRHHPRRHRHHWSTTTAQQPHETRERQTTRAFLESKSRRERKVHPGLKVLYSPAQLPTANSVSVHLWQKGKQTPTIGPPRWSHGVRSHSFTHTRTQPWAHLGGPMGFAHTPHSSVPRHHLAHDGDRLLLQLGVFEPTRQRRLVRKRARRAEPERAAARR